MFDERKSGVREFTVAIALFLGAIIFHAWGASAGWDSLNLPGQEFRQAQTALSAFFIQHEHNFSLAYPTPVLGKPWSVPMEFPLYQWAVVVVSNTTGLTLTHAARAVTLACFYLGLPAFYLLLRRLKLTPPRALVALGMVVVCPLYIFYARSFLIETMALMFGAWFFIAYVKAVEQRSIAWLATAVICGSGVGLVKVTTLLSFLMPAFVWSLWWLWIDWRENDGQECRRALVRRVIWCALVLAVPFAISYWWIAYSDAVKAKSIAGAFLQSSYLTNYNFGIGMRFSPALWEQHWRILFTQLASPPLLVVCGFLAVVFARRWWWMIIASVGFFFAVQVVFPILYAWHDYYYLANAMMLLFALGFCLCGLLESKLPRWVVWAVIAGAYVMQARTYLGIYHEGQKQLSTGGSDLTKAINQVTGPEDVMIVAGFDWDSAIPYFSQRRALMIHRSMEDNWALISSSLDALKGEEVTSLVLAGKQRENHRLIAEAERRFGVDPRPVFTWRESTVYLHRNLRADAIDDLRMLAQLVITPEAQKAEEGDLKMEVEMTSVPSRYRARFGRMSPQPWKYYTLFGTKPFVLDGRSYYSAHPDSKLWFRVGEGEHHMSIEVMLWPEAYSDKVKLQDRSDGVEVKVFALAKDGSRRELSSRWINPLANVSDRGLQKIEFDFSLPVAGDVELDVLPGPHNNYARDWTMLGDIKIN